MPPTANWQYNHQPEAGSADLLRQFLEGGWWDEIRVLENTTLRLGGGVAAPLVPSAAFLAEKWTVGADVARVSTSRTLLPDEL